MAHTTNPGQASSSSEEQLAVLNAGLATSALALAGVFLVTASSQDFQIMRWKALTIIPAGAILVGIVASSGYGLASWLKGVKVSGLLLAAIVALQICVFFGGQYIEFWIQGLIYEDGTPVRFLTYFDWTTSFAFDKGAGDMGTHLGRLGYGLRALEIAGFAGVGLLVPAMLRSKAR